MLQSNYSDSLKHQILLVEDSPVIQLVHESTLQGAGFTVDTAESGKEALAMCAKHKYKLILMDINLPDMTGLEITTRIRQNNHLNKTVPIVALTSYTEKEIKKQCLECGMNEYRHKPINQKQLATLADKYLFPNHP